MEVWTTKSGSTIPVQDMDTKHLISAFIITGSIEQRKYNPNIQYTPAPNAPAYASNSWRVSASSLYWALFNELRKRGRI